MLAGLSASMGMAGPGHTAQPLVRALSSDDRLALVPLGVELM